MVCAFSTVCFCEWMVSVIIPCPVTVPESYDLGYLLAQGFILQNIGSVRVNMESFVSSESNERLK